jgi:hypothetical protein
MAALTTCAFVKRIPLTATAGGLVIEVWKIVPSTDGDTQTLALPFIKTVLAVVGPVTATIPNTVDHALDVITIATIDASTLSHALVIGTE